MQHQLLLESFQSVFPDGLSYGYQTCLASPTIESQIDCNKLRKPIPCNKSTSIYHPSIYLSINHLSKGLYQWNRISIFISLSSGTTSQLHPSLVFLAMKHYSSWLWVLLSSPAVFECAEGRNSASLMSITMVSYQTCALNGPLKWSLDEWMCRCWEAEGKVCWWFLPRPAHLPSVTFVWPLCLWLLIL